MLIILLNNIKDNLINYFTNYEKDFTLNAGTDISHHTPQQFTSSKSESEPVSIIRTLLLLVVIFLGSSILSGFIFGIYFGVVQEAEFEQAAFDIWFEQIPVLLCFTILTSFFSLLTVISATKGNTWSQRFDYWALKAISKKELFKWLLVICIFWLVTGAIAELLNIPDEPFMNELMSASNSVAVNLLIIVSICFVAPIVEEVVFRGWLYTRIEQSKIASIGAIIVTSILFTLIHTQYEQAYSFLMLLIFGYVLAWVRYKTNNISYSIAMHFVYNALTIAVIFLF